MYDVQQSRDALNDLDQIGRHAHGRDCAAGSVMGVVSHQAGNRTGRDKTVQRK